MAYQETKAEPLSEKPGAFWKQYPVIRTDETSIEGSDKTNRHTRSQMATIKNDDERLLARIGYRQVS